MALAYCLYHIVNNKQAEITIYGEFLEKHPPAYEAQIFENTSWSCAHGIERWRSNCGCNSGMHQGWTQEWRKPLREAMDWLRDRLSGVYEKQASSLLQNPWEARNKYIDVILDRSMKNVEKFLSRESGRELSGEEKVKALKLLEMQRHAMLIFTSCGWFFDEISGIETTQVMQYAARAMQLAREVGDRNFEDEFIEKLQAAPSNIREFENGAQVYEKYIQPATLDLLRVGSHYAVSSLFEEYPSSTQIYCYRAENKNYDKVNAGRLEMAVGRAHIRSDITWNESEISFVVLYLGGHILNGGVREFMGEEAFSEMYRDTKAAFLKSDIPEVIRLMDDHFETHNYSLWHLFKDQQRKVFDQILASSLEEIELHFRQIYQYNHPIYSV